MEYDLISREILRSLLKRDLGSDGVLFKTLGEEVWCQVKKFNLVSESSLKNKLLNRRLKKLENDRLVFRKEKSKKTVYYRLKNAEAQERAKTIVLGAPNNLLIAFTQYALHHKIVSDVPQIFSEFSMLVFMPFWIKIMKAHGEKNAADLEFYKTQGALAMGEIFRSAVSLSELVFTPEKVKEALDSFDFDDALHTEADMDNLVLKWLENPGNTELLIKITDNLKKGGKQA